MKYHTFWSLHHEQSLDYLAGNQPQNPKVILWYNLSISATSLIKMFIDFDRLSHLDLVVHSCPFPCIFI